MTPQCDQGHSDLWINKTTLNLPANILAVNFWYVVLGNLLTNYTACHAEWHLGQRRSSSTLVYPLPIFRWCHNCVLLYWLVSSSSCSMEIFLGQNIFRILRTLVVWKGDSLDMWYVIPPALWCIKEGGKYTALIHSYRACAILCWFPYCLHARENTSGLIQPALDVRACTSILAIVTLPKCVNVVVLCSSECPIFAAEGFGRLKVITFAFFWQILVQLVVFYIWQWVCGKRARSAEKSEVLVLVPSPWQC